MVGREELVRRQRALAHFGEYVLRCDDLQKILDESCRLVSDALDVDLSKVLEIERARNTALVVAGFGWKPEVVGKARVALDERSSEAYALGQGKPVIMQDIASETRFDIPEFMKAHDVRALVNVPIFLPGGEAFGLLQVDDRKARDFGEDDTEFLRTYATILGPVIDRLRKVRDLEHNNERLRLIIESAHDYAILLSDPQDIITDWLAGAESIFGWTAHEVIGQPGSVLFTEEDQAAGVPQQEADGAARDGVAPNVRWHRRKDGSRVFIDGQTVALHARDGALRGYMKIGQDTTARRRDQERQGMLLAELQHRVRNVVAMVRAIISKGDGASVDDFRAHLLGRINAMGRTQAHLTRWAGVGVELEDLVREELFSQIAQEDRITITGAPVALAPRAAEVLTLVLHELATNALKYGALGQAQGRVEVSWSTELNGEQEWLRLTWRESGVRLLAIAPLHVGFGMELITKRVPYELRCRGAMDVNPGGLLCTIEFPLMAGESILQSDSPEAYRDLAHPESRR